MADYELTSRNTQQEDKHQFHLSSRTTRSIHRAIYGLQSSRSLGVFLHCAGGKAFVYVEIQPFKMKNTLIMTNTVSRKVNHRLMYVIC